MLNFNESGDWADAFQKVIPMRKNWTVSTEKKEENKEEITVEKKEENKEEITVEKKEEE